MVTGYTSYSRDETCTSYFIVAFLVFSGSVKNKQETSKLVIMKQKKEEEKNEIKRFENADILQETTNGLCIILLFLCNRFATVRGDHTAAVLITRYNSSPNCPIKTYFYDRVRRRNVVHILRTAAVTSTGLLVLFSTKAEKSP